MNQKGRPSRPKPKTAFKVKKTFEPIYTGGRVAFTTDRQWLVATAGDDVLVTNVKSGARVATLEGDSAVTTLAITPTDHDNVETFGSLIIARRSLHLTFYRFPTTEIFSLAQTVARAHDSPITFAVSDPTSSLFATGSVDGIVKAWDAAQGHCTHVFRGHSGVISALKFDISLSSTAPRSRLISGAEDSNIRIWDLTSRQCLATLEGHVSIVRGVEITPDGQTLISGSRDRVLNVWDLNRKGQGSIRLTIPVLETIETIGLLKYADKKGKGKQKAEDSFTDVVYTAGNQGTIKLWSISSGKEVDREVPSSPVAVEINDVIHLPNFSELVVVQNDQNLAFLSYSISSSGKVKLNSRQKQLIGFNDEIVDVAFLSRPEDLQQDTLLAVATNSASIRIYKLETDDKFDETQLLTGHEDVVLSLCRSSEGTRLVSGSKDRTARVWQWRNDTQSWACIGVCIGHVESVGAVAFSHISPEELQLEFVVTASQDQTVKLWDLTIPNIAPNGPPHLKALHTQKIHDKDINSLDVNPFDRLLLSGSQDKTAKLFSISTSPSTAKSEPSVTLSLMGVFKGHKRGVWSVKFARKDYVAATSSGDRTVKLWDIRSFTCLHTFEGHTNSVLRVDFMSHDTQLVTCASDGLVKVWNVRDEDCVATLDNHEDKIWALAINAQESTIVSAGADSVITLWADITEEKRQEQMAEKEQLIIKNQDYENFVAAKDYRSAILLALSLDQPRRLLNLFAALSASSPRSLAAESTYTGSSAVDRAIASLDDTNLYILLEFCRDWNTSLRTADVAQTVLYTIFKSFSAEKLLLLKSNDPTSGSNVSAIIEALLPYTERHFSRADKLLAQDSAIVEYTLSAMSMTDSERMDA